LGGKIATTATILTRKIFQKAPDAQTLDAPPSVFIIAALFSIKRDLILRRFPYSSVFPARDEIVCASSDRVLGASPLVGSQRRRLR
jgi:hypothetical protein